MSYRRAKRARMAPWRRPWCWLLGHDWGMYWNQSTLDYDDICVRCGARRR